MSTFPLVDTVLAALGGGSSAPDRSREINTLDARSLHLLEQKRCGQMAWLTAHLTTLRATAVQERAAGHGPGPVQGANAPGAPIPSATTRPPEAGDAT